MGDLKWKNNSSSTVEWFFTTVLGSQSATLHSGNEHCQQNHPEIMSVGLKCEKGPVYVINNFNTKYDIELIASDVIPIARQ
ncbi:hypothetical protein [uncultured Candidatus Kuenenia sp.]|jgi:hypothetical protein|uniref:hypothetical protein n=1 Tax=uncultured Candidatus Kuenenia sp. TaxID=1048336 RepID=UPI0025CDED17|nr:hypothetical protein [uncultured Candidatus Kuenenia sp.]